MESGEYGKLCVSASLRLCVDVVQGHVAVLLRQVADRVFLAQVFGFDDDVRHGGVLWSLVGSSGNQSLSDANLLSDLARDSANVDFRD